MTAPQTVCHLSDAFRVCTGEKYASPANNLFGRTVMKWVALRTSVPWPQNIETRPELDQCAGGGTKPSDWKRDCDDLCALIHSFAERTSFAEHPIFGRMNRKDWLVWGYRHVDHHLRQFGA